MEILYKDMQELNEKDFVKQMVPAYRDYLDELSLYADKPFDTSDAEIEKVTKGIGSYTYNEIIGIYDGKKMIGFLIMGTAPNCNPEADRYIAETFLKKEYRGKGIMTNLIKNYTDKFPGMYTLFILHRNKPARKYWTKLFTETLNATEYNLQEDNSNETMKEYAYKIVH